MGMDNKSYNPCLSVMGYIYSRIMYFLFRLNYYYSLTNWVDINWIVADLLKKSAPSRIIVVASELYRFASVNLDKLNPTDTRFPLYLYYVSKYANIYFTRELAKRLEGSGVTANCLHPGMIDSGIFRNVPRPLNWGLWLIVKGFFKTPQQGCQTSVHLAVSSEVEGINGKYFMDCKERSLSTEAMNDEKAKKLWDASIKLVNLQKNELKIW